MQFNSPVLTLSSAAISSQVGARRTQCAKNRAVHWMALGCVSYVREAEMQRAAAEAAAAERERQIREADLARRAEEAARQEAAARTRAAEEAARREA